VNIVLSFLLVWPLWLVWWVYLWWYKRSVRERSK
jgi:hypothetical protein